MTSPSELLPLRTLLEQGGSELAAIAVPDMGSGMAIVTINTNLVDTARVAAVQHWALGELTTDPVSVAFLMADELVGLIG